MTESAAESFQLATLLGIVSQLYSTRMNTLLRPHGFTLAQFALLNHLANVKSQSITELTQAMEINQPGVTKIIQKFEREAWVTVSPDPKDSRKKQISISEAGQQHILTVGAALFPDVKNWFADWDSSQKAQFRQQLASFAGWLDENRLTP